MISFEGGICHRLWKGVPQGLKPSPARQVGGTAEAVPGTTESRALIQSTSAVTLEKFAQSADFDGAKAQRFFGPHRHD